MDSTEAARIELQSTPRLPIKFLMAIWMVYFFDQTAPAAAECNRSSAIKLKMVSVTVTDEPSGNMMRVEDLQLVRTVDARGLHERERDGHIVLTVHEDTGGR